MAHAGGLGDRPDLVHRGMAGEQVLTQPMAVAAHGQPHQRRRVEHLVHEGVGATSEGDQGVAGRGVTGDDDGAVLGVETGRRRRGGSADGGRGDRHPDDGLLVHDPVDPHLVDTDHGTQVRAALAVDAGLDVEAVRGEQVRRHLPKRRRSVGIDGVVEVRPQPSRSRLA